LSASTVSLAENYRSQGTSMPYFAQNYSFFAEIPRHEQFFCLSAFEFRDYCVILHSLFLKTIGL
ncbi:MAG: hypothetical protein Q4D23_00970, partial [Bacteroidales bacterium]|nr:hypothetical protein [Bacteroidales bacterium]